MNGFEETYAGLFFSSLGLLCKKQALKMQEKTPVRWGSTFRVQGSDEWKSNFFSKILKYLHRKGATPAKQPYILSPSYFGFQVT